MSLLDDARRLIAFTPWIERVDHESGESFSVCGICGQDNTHIQDCPWLSMPKIVVALDAAECFTRIFAEHVDGATSESDDAAEDIYAAVIRLQAALAGRT